VGQLGNRGYIVRNWAFWGFLNFLKLIFVFLVACIARHEGNLKRGAKHYMPSINPGAILFTVEVMVNLLFVGRKAHVGAGFNPRPSKGRGAWRA